MTIPADKPQTQDPDGFEAVHLALHPKPWRLSHLMALIVVLALLFWLWRITGGFVILLLIVAGFTAIFAGGSLWARRRAASQDALLSIMAIAAEKGMPLAPAVAAFATQYGGKTRRGLLGLATHLNSGESLSDSLSMVPTLLPRDAVLLARVGEESGALPKALRIGATSRATFLPSMSMIATRFTYVFFVLVAMQGIMGFVCYFIMPKFEAIFKDFGLSLPPATIILLDASHFVAKYSPIWVFLLLVQILLILLVPLKILVWFNVELPLIDRIFRRHHTALILRSLSLVTGEGKPIELVLSSLARNYPTNWVRRRLVLVKEDVALGEDWCVSLWRHGLIRESDGALLASAQASGNLPWALRQLADTSDRRMMVRLQAAVQMMFPLVIFSLGLFVLAVAVAFFNPLIHLIERLTGA